MNLLFNLKFFLKAILISSILFAWYMVSHFRSNYLNALESKIEAEIHLTEARDVITDMTAINTKSRELIATYQLQEQKLRNAGENMQRRYREAIKYNTCANQSMPDDIINLLHE